MLLFELFTLSVRPSTLRSDVFAFVTSGKMSGDVVCCRVGKGAMAKVDCFEIPGLYCWFWSNDHDPPHFHAKREGEWEIKVNFMVGGDEMFQRGWGDPPGGKILRQLRKAVVANRVALLAEWEAKVNQ